MDSLIQILLRLCSWFQNRYDNKKKSELIEKTLLLTEKKLIQISEDEAIAGQPEFVIKTLSIVGLGDFETPNYRVKITIDISNEGAGYSKARHVFVADIKRGEYLHASNIEIEYIDIRNNRAIEGNRTIIVRPSSNLNDSKLVISYVDTKGSEKFQQFQIFAGGRGRIREKLPSSIQFNFEKIVSIRDRNIWKI